MSLNLFRNELKGIVYPLQNIKSQSQFYLLDKKTYEVLINKQ